MSNHRSYFNKNNTIVFNDYVNTARNPIVDLYFGTNSYTPSLPGFSRFIFDIDLTTLIDKINSKIISLDCVDNMTHTLTMTNTIRLEPDSVNAFNSDSRKRASSFDLVLFRIPLTSGQTGDIQTWDEGVGYDFIQKDYSTINSQFYTYRLTDDTAYSTRPSNWFQNTNLNLWSEQGMYSNDLTYSGLNYNDLYIVDTQHFDRGDEDINFNMTDEINGILNGSITDVSGWGVAYLPSFEIITGLTYNYCVSFFSKYTQTFYEPYLLTTYNDLVQDDRNLFVEKIQNKLYLFAYIDGDLVSLDQTPTVNVLDSNGDPIPTLTGLVTCERTKGVYEVVIPPIHGQKTPCTFNDVWTNIKYQGQDFPDIENEFILQPYKNRMIIGTQSKEPEIFGFDFYGIKQDEKILNTDIRKVGVVIKKAYTTKHLLQNVSAQYRIFVREGNTEVQVQDWTEINRTPNEYYFMFDTRDKIPNEYYIDIRVNTSGEKDTYKRTLKFLIVNKK